MRYLTLILLFSFFSVCFGQTITHAVTNTSGTTTMISERIANSEVVRYTITSTSDAGGNVVATLPNIIGTLLRVATNPGATAPTDNWDVDLNDADGLDVFMGEGEDRDTANSEQFISFSTDGTNFAPGVVVAGTHTLAADDVGNAKAFVIRLYVRR